MVSFGEVGVIRIVSDGTPAGTQVLMPDGTPIEGVRSVAWSCEVGDPAVAILTVEARCDVQAAEVQIQRMREPTRPPRPPVRW